MIIEFNLTAPQVIQFIVAIVLPILVGLVTTKSTSSGAKAVLLALLAVITSLLNELLAASNAGMPFDLGSGLLAALGTFLVAVTMHYGLWKPTGTTEKALTTGRTDTIEVTPTNVRDHPRH